MIGRNDDCWCQSGLKWKKCHYPKNDPFLQKNPRIFEIVRDDYKRRFDIILKNDKQIQGIREAGKLAAFILDETCKQAKAGITTLELNDFAHNLHKQYGAIAAPLNYGEPPFPKSVCISLNDVICHGIPDATILKEGDILNIDVTSILNGYYGDCSKMVIIGKPTAEAQLVVDVAYESLMLALAICKPGEEISKIGHTIETYANSRNCSVVNDFVGHGVGIDFHENPQIPHHYNEINIAMVPGMTFTIEPMINAGKRGSIVDFKDQWTARTVDGKPSAQFEHTILITEEACEILTPWQR